MGKGGSENGSWVEHKRRSAAGLLGATSEAWVGTIPWVFYTPSQASHENQSTGRLLFAS